MGQNMSCTDDSSVIAVCAVSTRYIQKNQGRGADSGVGINFNVINDGSQQLQVHSVLPDGPAARAGTVLPGDVLLAVDGKNVYSILDQAEIFRLVRGAAGSTVKLSFRRGSQVVKDKQLSLGTRLGTVPIPSPRGLPDQAFTPPLRFSTVDERVRPSEEAADREDDDDPHSSKSFSHWTPWTVPGVSDEDYKRDVMLPRQETWSPKQTLADRSPNGNSTVGKRPLPPPMSVPGKDNEQGATVQPAGKGEIIDSQKGRRDGNGGSASGIHRECPVACVHTGDRTSPSLKLETAGFANNPIDAFGKGLEAGKGTEASTSASQEEDRFERTSVSSVSSVYSVSSDIQKICSQEKRGDMQNASATIAFSTATVSQSAFGLVSNSSNLRVDTANYSPKTYQMSMGSPSRQQIAGLPSPASLTVASQRSPPAKPISIHNSSLSPPVASQRSRPVKSSSIPISPSLSSGDGRSQSAASRTSSGTAVRTSSPSGADAISPLLRPISPITEIRMMEGSASGGTSQKGPPRVAASQPAAQTQRKTNGPVGVVIRGRQIGHPSAAAQYGVVPGF